MFLDVEQSFHIAKTDQYVVTWDVFFVLIDDFLYESFSSGDKVSNLIPYGWKYRYSQLWYSFFLMVLIY